MGGKRSADIMELDEQEFTNAKRSKSVKGGGVQSQVMRDWRSSHARTNEANII